ncbi:phosphodiester glycosidase family protein [Mariniphaga sediminis]|uniref:Phosphodiester glycosidase family protein n=1 Tax=Mariniphaga sediminis TaxID=1628158 RepID=A0A399D7Z6_9BACT|nr:phosphodiester glycosidase family protein [Mariniphaga sediminis]RIH67178.1 phosphodiester glycosidase family protein [Mariniphaga sediminis]
MKKLMLYILGFVFVLFIHSCEEKETYAEFIPIPSTENGEKLVENTDLFASIYRDTTYSLVNGVDVTEMAYLSVKGLAMRLFLFEVDLSVPGVTLQSSLPYNKYEFAMQPMTEQALAVDSEETFVWGGTNGDFYNMNTGVPRGLYVRDGLVLKNAFDSGDRSFFAITDNGKAAVGSVDDYPQMKDDIKEAVGGSVWLVRNGVVVAQTNNSVEPRTAIGISEDQNKVFIMVIDGRNFSYSNGMTYTELGQCLSALGAHEAINLDGGGSSTFFIRNTPDFTEDRFELVNWPSDRGGKERAVANGLFIVSEN